ncbi:hypothetical protein [Rufibacter ruber]|uniref:hypothetical protein n=1 Tax=Rufibacter ruber TaxID=1783499 RepID=UPI000837A0B3|nr:hypothetical protein [Rufibacter ruber]
MPIGETEFHPYLLEGEIADSDKLILGSFPVYECTNPDNDKKIAKRDAVGSVRFFYGSAQSSFWQLYSSYVDNQLTLPPNPTDILASLREHRISISDNIVFCERKVYSSLDSDLVSKSWNSEGLGRLFNNGISKVLCTSKGVLSDLENKIICPAYRGLGQVDPIQSAILQNVVLDNVGGNENLIVNPIARVFRIGDRVVEALAIPSPGSPERKILDFGYGGVENSAYAENYFANAFNWLMD